MNYSSMDRINWSYTVKEFEGLVSIYPEQRSAIFIHIQYKKPSEV